MVVFVIISVLLGAIGQILVKIGAQHLELNFTCFKEHITVYRLIGTALIIMGVVFVARS